MFLIIKVNFPINLRLFYGILKPLRARRIKKYYRGWDRRERGGGGQPAYEKCWSLKVT